MTSQNNAGLEPQELELAPSPRSGTQQFLLNPLTILISVLLVLLLILASILVYDQTRSSREPFREAVDKEAATQSTSALAKETPGNEESPDIEADQGRGRGTYVYPNSGSTSSDAGTAMDAYGLPVGAIGCMQDVSRNGVTSEKFCNAVGAAFAGAVERTHSFPPVLQVKSSVTDNTYTMRCQRVKQYAHCTGGNGAAVYISLYHLRGYLDGQWDN